MNLQELFFEIAPAMKAVLDLGFIPRESDIYELTPEQYTAYESKGGDISQKLFTVFSKIDKNNIPENEIWLLSEDDISKLWKGVKSIYKHAKRAGCASENDEDILAAAASVLPSEFSEDSRFKWKE
jgi:hypothetical protein